MSRNGMVGIPDKLVGRPKMKCRGRPTLHVVKPDQLPINYCPVTAPLARFHLARILPYVPSLIMLLSAV